MYFMFSAVTGRTFLSEVDAVMGLFLYEKLTDLRNWSCRYSGSDLVLLALVIGLFEFLLVSLCSWILMVFPSTRQCISKATCFLL